MYHIRGMKFNSILEDVYIESFRQFYLRYMKEFICGQSDESIEKLIAELYGLRDELKAEEESMVKLEDFTSLDLKKEECEDRL